jgi:pimeloyl-ACP methyl ester carboxylesterase
LAGREAIVIAPKHAAPGQPWIWRAEFFDAFAYADRALLDKGWHIAYYRLSHMFGCPFAIHSMEAFRACASEYFHLAPKPALFGFSRGGLYAVGYAAAYPQNVAALYLDAPVVDIRSWPGGKGQGTGSPGSWEECLAILGLTEEEASTWSGNPIHKASLLAAASIPVLIVAGDADTAVPYAENAMPFERQYREAGGWVQSIIKPGAGHHPHSLEDPEPIVAFMEQYAIAAGRT